MTRRIVPALAVTLALLSVLIPAASLPAHARAPYGWRADSAAPAATLAERIPPPPGFERKPQSADSFATWLRGLPMRADGAPVLTHTGKPKWRQDVHAAVIDIDIGTRDLQQCADAIMRLRAEWLFSQRRDTEIAFNNTNGKRMRFASAKRRDHAGLRKYMDLVFAYAGTYSLERELKPVAPEAIAIGDVFIKGGFPAAWAYTQPAYRAIVKQADYAKTFGAGGQWRGVQVHQVSCEAERCTVRIRLTTRVTLPPFRGQELTGALDETWVREDGNWWYYQNF